VEGLGKGALLTVAAELNADLSAGLAGAAAAGQKPPGNVLRLKT
jgi:hypothetical protein